MDDRTAELLANEDARATMGPDEFDHAFLEAHLTDERRKASLRVISSDDDDCAARQACSARSAR